MKKIILQTIHNFFKDEAVLRGAALSFFAIFSLPAALILTLSTIGFYLGTETAQAQLITFIKTLFSNDLAQLTQQIIPAIVAQSPQKLDSLLSIILLIISSSALFTHLIKALNHILGTPKKAPRPHITRFFVGRLLSFLTIIFFIALLFVSLLAGTVISVINSYIATQILFGIEIAQVTNFLLSFVLTFLLFIFIFKFLPTKKITWKSASQGALFSTVLFIIGRSLLFSAINNLTNFSAFGAASTLIILLVWIFYSSQTVLAGAELIKSVESNS